MYRTLIAAALVSSLLAGCTGLLTRISASADRDAAASQNFVQGASQGRAVTHDTNSVIVNDGLWLSGNTVKLAEPTTLPSLFGEPANFERTVTSLQDFAERITRLTQIPTKVSDDAIQAAARASMQDSGLAAGTASGTNTRGTNSVRPPLPAGGIGGIAGLGGGRAGNSAAMGNELTSVPVHIAYRGGTLKGLLDAASARFGVYWQFADGAIDFYYTKTRTFQIDAVPGDSSLNANVVSGASTSGNTSNGMNGGLAGTGGTGNTGVTSNNTANTVMRSQLSVFDSLQASIHSMLSPYGSAVSSPATGSISVTDTPDVLDRVAHFVEEQNRVLSRQVLINVTVLSVDLSAHDSYGINWNAVYQALSTRFGLTTAFTPALQNASSFSASVIGSSSRASGTSAIISALSEQGKVHRKTSASVTTLNNQPVPVQVATQTGYLASVSTTNTANVGSQTSLTPGTVTTGFNMILLPHVLDDGTVLLQFYSNISALDALTTVSSGSGSNAQQIQTPEIETRNFMQRVSMRSGQTLVISGYENTNDNLDQSGVGKPSNYALGGGYNAGHDHSIIVILITPLTMAGA